MQPQAITLPEVQGYAQKARFFLDGERAKVEISFVGSKDTVVKKVGPTEMAQFRDEWNAFCDGRPAERRQGTPLVDVGMPSEKAEEYIFRNVHTLEELSSLSDAQCQGLGHGTLTYRQNARKLLSSRALEKAAKDRDDVSAAAATLTSAVEAKVEQSTGDIAELKAQVGEMASNIGKLTELVGALLGATGKDGGGEAGAGRLSEPPRRGPGRPRRELTSTVLPPIDVVIVRPPEEA